MSTLTFDTHKFIRRLRDAGFEEAQAEAVSDAFREAHGELEPPTKQDLDALELRLEAKISDIKSEMIKWFAGMMLAQAGLIAALVKLL